MVLKTLQSNSKLTDHNELKIQIKNKIYKKTVVQGFRDMKLMLENLITLQYQRDIS